MREVVKIKILDIVLNNKLKVLINIIFIIFYTATSTVTALVMTTALDALMNLELNRFINQIVIFIGLWVVSLIFQYLNNISIEQIIQNTSQLLRDRAINQLNQEVTDNAMIHNYSKYINMASNDIVTIEEGLKDFFELISSFFIIIFTSFALLWLDYRLLLLSIGLSAVLFLVPSLFQKKIGEDTKRVSEQREKLTQNLENWVNGSAI